MTISSELLFPPNTTKKNLWLFSLAFGIVLIIGILLLVIGLTDTSNENNYLVSGIVMTLLGLSFFVLGKSQSKNVAYFVDPKGIRLKRGKKELYLPYLEVEEIIELKEEKGEEIIKEFINKIKIEQYHESKEAIGSLSLDKLKNAFKMQAQAHNHFIYLSVPVVYRGDENKVTYDKVNLPCDCVLILLKNKEGYFITPKDTQSFVTESNKFLNK